MLIKIRDGDKASATYRTIVDTIVNREICAVEKMLATARKIVEDLERFKLQTREDHDEFTGKRVFANERQIDRGLISTITLTLSLI